MNAVALSSSRPINHYLKTSSIKNGESFRNLKHTKHLCLLIYHVVENI